MTLMRELREAARTGGHLTEVWDVGQDVCFRHAETLVNVEVKSVGSGVEQYRLGVGQLAEQIQNHLDHIAAGTAWYVESGVRAVAGILVVTDDVVPPVWGRLAQRLGIAIWSADEAVYVFSDPELSGLPSGIDALPSDER
jgi:hypothetical protein